MQLPPNQPDEKSSDIVKVGLVASCTSLPDNVTASLSPHGDSRCAAPTQASTLGGINAQSEEMVIDIYRTTSWEEAWKEEDDCHDFD